MMQDQNLYRWIYRDERIRILEREIAMLDRYRQSNWATFSMASKELWTNQIWFKQIELAALEDAHPVDGVRS